MNTKKKVNHRPKSSRARKRRLSQKQSEALNFETLESRHLLASIAVTNATDVISFDADTSSIAALVVNSGSDGVSLREAVTAANNTAGADEITFEEFVFGEEIPFLDGSGDVFGGERVIRLTQGELEITDSLIIDATSALDLTITGDADGDDVTFAGTYTTDLSASLVGPVDRLDDNSRVLNFSALFGDLTLREFTISGGRRTGDGEMGGGILFSSFGALSLDQSTVSGNSTASVFGSGGGIASNVGTVSLTNSTVSGNRTMGNSAYGGGIGTSGGTVFLTNSTVSDNNSYFGGGGIGTSGGNVSLTNSTVSDNAGFFGGGIRSTGGNVSLTNSTISGNSSGYSGGGILSFDATILLVNSTVSDNTAFTGGGISFMRSTFNSNSSLTLHNSIVAGNTGNGSAPDIETVAGAAVNVLDVENSLIGDTSGSGITANTGDGNILNQSALLGPLTDNGGPTLTHALLTDSPAIDGGNNALAVDENGNPLATDQRGELRSLIIGTADIGAFEVFTDSEFEAGSLVVTTNLDVEDRTDNVTSLREAIAFANDPTAGVNNDGDADGDGLVADAIAFDTTVFTGGDNNLIRLTQGQLRTRESLSIDGSSVSGVVITGDANGNDITVPGTHITDVAATAEASGFLSSDNSRVLSILAGDGELTLTGIDRDWRPDFIWRRNCRL